MTAQPQNFFQLKNIAQRLILVFVLGFTVNREHLCSNQPFVTPTASLHSVPSVIHSSLEKMTLDGNLSFDGIEHAARDFGNRYHIMPYAVLYPQSVSDISSMIKCIFHMGLTSELTVAARGRGHSLQGQAQAYRGVVIIMESLQVPKMSFHDGKLPYVDVSAGELWINILHESLKHGMAPKSWTDYLHLTVGGTLSNAGVSGQAFRHGPQINNVYELKVVTGRGEVVTCSEDQNAELFHAVLGGLGQFGIITQARIALEVAPRKVKWIRALYSDFSAFTKDQEHLISSENTFDYIEGFVIINRTGLLNYWRSSFKPKDHVQASQFSSEGKILFCLEVAKYFNPEGSENIDQAMWDDTGQRFNQKQQLYVYPKSFSNFSLFVAFGGPLDGKDVDTLLSKLNYIKSTLFWSEVPYTDFLDRVHTSEIKLREKGLWEVPHPWLNLLIPRSRIHEFAQQVFGNIVKDTSNGPVLIYPVNKSRWKTRTSMITPEEDIFYLVAFLASAMPSSRGNDSLEYILAQSNKILELCEKQRLGVKQYLPHYNTKAEWKAHFGTQWEDFSKRKFTYDPFAILAPGQKIFSRADSLTRQ